jgi:hypothetical protein
MIKKIWVQTFMRDILKAIIFCVPLWLLDYFSISNVVSYVVGYFAAIFMYLVHVVIKVRNS